MITTLRIAAGPRTLWDYREQYQPPKHRVRPRRRSKPAPGDSVEISEAGYLLAHPEAAPKRVAKS
jgi:hypothetical protein